MTDHHPDNPADSEPDSPADASPSPDPARHDPAHHDPARPSSPFGEWAPTSQPPPPPIASPMPASEPIQMWQPVPAQPGPDPAIGAYGAPVYGGPPPGYGYRPLPLFPPGPPGLSPTPDDPLVSADYNGWWSRSFRLLRSMWRQAALVQLLGMVPLIAMVTVSGIVFNDSVTELVNTPQGVEPDWRPIVRSLAYLLPFGLLASLLTLLVSLATLHLVVQTALGRPLSVRLALHTAVRRAPAYLGWGFLGALLTLVGFLFCFLPGYYVAAVLSFLPTVVLLERGQALSRCFQLFHARLGDALARLATIFGLGLAVGLAEQAFFLISGVAFHPGTAAGFPLGAFAVLSVLSIVLSSVSQIVFAPLQVTAYADMRARHEPFSTAYLSL